MIRILFFIPISLLFALPLKLNAQGKNKAPEVQKFTIGFKVGPSVTLGTYPDKELRDKFKTQPKLGVIGTFFVILPLKNEYSYLAEAGYGIKGRKVKLTNGGFINNQTFQVVEMSMALRKSYKLKLAKNIPSKWFFNVGPNVEYWVNAKGKFVETKYAIKFNVPPDADLYTNYLTNPNRWLFGIDVGIGADAPINRRQKVRLELRGTFGQTYLGKKNSASSYATLSWDDTLKTNLKTFAFTVAYTLDFDMRAMKMGKSTKNKEMKKRR